MELSLHNIQRITQWIHNEIDDNFLNPGYTISFQDEKVLLQQSAKELKQVCPLCLLVPKYLLFFKCRHLTCPICLIEYRRHRFMFENQVTLSNLQAILPSK